MSIFKYGGTVFKNMLKHPSTLMYPAVPREWQERTRGHIEIQTDLCILCGMCSKKCPALAIKVSRDDRTVTIERMSCVQCSSCADSCPKKCIMMKQEYTPPNADKVVDIFHIPEKETDSQK